MSQGTTGIVERSLRASMWVLASQPVHMVLQLARNLILARLLFPEAFGLMAMINSVVTGLKLCSDVGIDQALIQKQGTEQERFLQTAWTMQIVRGMLLCGLCAALAWPAALAMGEPELLKLLPVAGLSLILSAMGSKTLVLRHRAVELGGTTMFGLANGLLSMFITIGLAWALKSVWALVIGSVVSSGITAALSHVCFRGPRHRLRWDRPIAREIFRFGSWIFVSTVLTFLARNVNPLVLGALVEAKWVGLFAIAGMFARIPDRFVGSLTNSVLFPALSETAREDRARLEARVINARQAIFRTTGAIVAMVAYAAPLFFLLLYDPRYHEAGWIARALVFFVWVEMVEKTTTPVLLSVADTRMLAVLNFSKSVFGIGGSVAGFMIAGLPGFIAGRALGPLTAEVLALWKLHRWRIRLVRQDLLSTALTMTLALAAVGIELTLAEHVSGVEGILIRIGVGVVFALGLGLTIGRPVLNFVIARLRPAGS